MTTPTGTISLNDVNIELGRSGTTNISLNETAVRTLAGVASGTISMNDLRGKSNRVTLSYTFSSSTANASLNVSAIGGYISGKSDITVTINSGVYLYATSTADYGLNLTGATTGDTVTIINNGFIMGMGGTGGGYPAGAFVEPTVGGPALNIGTGIGVTINNTNGSAYIGGGGGGGGRGSAYNSGGGGAGGGTGGTTNFTSGNAGGAGGSIGASGGDGTKSGAGGGGRIFPGTGGAARTTAATKGSTLPGLGGGSGGSGAAYSAGAATTSGAGGSANNAGGNSTLSAASTTNAAGGGGGGWGASGGGGHAGTNRYAGAAGGKAVNLNGNSVTWVSGNTTRVYGAVA